MIDITTPTREIIEWSKQNLMIDNPEYMKKMRMGFWVGNTPKRISLVEYANDRLSIPYGCLRQIYPMIQDDKIISLFKQNPTEIKYGENPISLYDYQEIAVAEAMKAKYGILQSKAGSGKTRMGLAITQRWGRKTLWLTHTYDLLKQSMNAAKEFFPDELIGTITAGEIHTGKGITFATVQTMAKIDLDRFKNEWDVIIVDECHRVAGSPTAVTQFYKVLSSLAARHKYGLSATVHRADGLIKATYSLLGQVIYSVPDKAIEDRVMQIGIRPIETDLDYSLECLNTDGTLNYQKLITYMVYDMKRNQLIVDQLEDGHSTLVLTSRLEHNKKLLELLPYRLRQKAISLSGSAKKEARDLAMKYMKTGEKQILFATYNLAKEGLDIPCLDRLILATPQKDYAIVTQAIGRIARVCEGKDNPICIDIVDSKIRYCLNAFKQRMRIYKKNNCYEDVRI